MTKILHRSESRGFADHGWLKSHHTFSFASYRNEERMHFGLLRVLNDDVIAGGKGFDTHPHENMEIISIPLSGSLEHKDSEGNEYIIRAGDVQVMSAGTGISHSEYNHSPTEEVSLLQIWVFPKMRDIQPRYDQSTIDFANAKGRFYRIVGPLGDESSEVSINQDAFFSIGDFDENQSFKYELQETQNGLYLFLIEGRIEVADEKLNSRDAIGLSSAPEITGKAVSRSRILLMEVPLQ